MSPKKNRVRNKPSPRQRRKRQQQQQQNAARQLNIPEHTSSSPTEFFNALDQPTGLSPLLIVAWQQSVTEGMTICVGAADVAAIDELAAHTHGHLVYNIGGEPANARDNVIPLPGDVQSSISSLLQRRPQYVSMIYLASHAADVLPLVADRLIPGSVVVLSADMLEDFCAWADANGRKAYAMLRDACKAVVTLLAN